MPQLDTTVSDLNEIVSDHRRKVLPWQRSQIPNLTEAKSLEEQIEARKQLRELIERGRWWYRLMTPLRALLSVWSEPFGRILCVGMVGFVYMLCIILYILAIEYRSETIGLDYQADTTVLDIVWPWGMHAEVVDVIDRRNAQLRLYRLSETMGWYIPHSKQVLKEHWFPVGDIKPSMTYMEWDEIALLEEQLATSLRLKPKVDEMYQRAAEIGWRIYPEPPYINESEIDEVFSEVEQAEILKPIVDDLVVRGNIIGWELGNGIRRNPYDELQVQRLEQQLIESERLFVFVEALREQYQRESWDVSIEPPYTEQEVERLARMFQETIRLKPLMATLFARAEAIGWNLIDSPYQEYPYTKEKFATFNQELNHMERVHASVQQMIQEADFFHWDLTEQLGEAPYDEGVVISYQAMLGEMQRLEPQVREIFERFQELGARYTIDVPFSYATVRQNKEMLEEYERYNPVGELLMQSLRELDVDGKLLPLYSFNDVEKLHVCLERRLEMKDEDKGEECLCVHDKDPDYTYVVCDVLDEDDPLVTKVLEDLREAGVSPTSSGPYTKNQLAHLQTCASIARRGKPTGFYLCSCTMGVSGSTYRTQVRCQNGRDIVVLE